uniref:GH16 domain-containing protein n=1 Tax=Ananas comosus var. bracteatus TaxID=296719 RepID=A0A6V7PMV7_ANACO|nr:unnamed protein product [Ananas comosus var. bracteatus]
MALSRGSPLLPVFLTGLLWAVKLGSSPWAASGLSKFDDVIQPSWASDHVIYDGDLLLLKLDNFSGSGFASKNKYLYGKATADIKLVPGDSAGTVTAFYMSSEGASHNEFDFEFLGNRSGEPYLVQTNLYIDGVGNREQRMDLWFDPTADFHSYGILWNPRQVVFLVDGTPSGSTRTTIAAAAVIAIAALAVAAAFLRSHGPADGGVLVDLERRRLGDGRGQGEDGLGHAPFVAAYREVRIDGCEWGPAAGDSDDAGELRRCSESAWGRRAGTGGRRRPWRSSPCTSRTSWPGPAPTTSSTTTAPTRPASPSPHPSAPPPHPDSIGWWGDGGVLVLLGAWNLGPTEENTTTTFPLEYDSLEATTYLTAAI